MATSRPALDVAGIAPLLDEQIHTQRALAAQLARIGPAFGQGALDEATSALEQISTLAAKSADLQAKLDAQLAAIEALDVPDRRATLRKLLPTLPDPRDRALLSELLGTLDHELRQVAQLRQRVSELADQLFALTDEAIRAWQRMAERAEHVGYGADGPGQAPNSTITRPRLLDQTA